MSVYMIMIREKTKDEEAFKAYGEAAAAAMPGHDLTPLAFYGPHEVFEGAAAEGVVLVRFPDADAAKAWYNSPAYNAAKKLRFQGADYRVIMVDGIDAGK